MMMTREYINCICFYEAACFFVSLQIYISKLFNLITPKKKRKIIIESSTPKLAGERKNKDETPGDSGQLATELRSSSVLSKIGLPLF